MRKARLAMRTMATAAILAGLGSVPAQAQVLIIGNDAKPHMVDGKTTMGENGHDTLSIIDMSRPGDLRMIATIPLTNSIIGPPVNLAVTPNRQLALVANSVNDVKKPNGSYAPVSDDEVYVVDLTASPPAVIDTLHVGKRPSGMAINHAGTLALVANRDDGTISVLSISGKTVKVIGTVTIGKPADSVSAVAISPDGKHALATKPGDNKIALLSINGDTVTYDKRDLPTGIFPYNVAISPTGKIALTADNGNGGTSDGNAKSVGVIDLTQNPVRVINHITVGDSPEGLAISPRGNIAVSVEAQGSNQPKTSWFYHPTGQVSVFAINGTSVRKVETVQVGGLPEAVAFSADGSYLYVGNFIDNNLSVFRVVGSHLVSAGYTYNLPGQPASMRGGPQ